MKIRELLSTVFCIAAVVVCIILFSLLPCEQAQQMMSKKQYDQAIKLLNGAAGNPLFKYDPSVYLTRAACYRAKQQYDQALGDIDKGLELTRQQPVIAFIENINRVHSLEYSFLEDRGWLLYKKDDLPSALEAFTRAIEIDSSAEALTGRAAVYEEMKKYPEAEKDYENAIKSGDSHDREMAYHERAIYHRHRNQLDDAIKDLNSAVNASTCAKAYLDRGLIYQQKGEFKSALADFNDSIRYDSYVERAYHARAEVSIELGNLNGALDDIKKAIDLDPSCEEAVADKAKIEGLIAAKEKKN